MIALPSAPAPAPRRQLLVGTTVACAAVLALVGGMLAVWMRFRDTATSVDGGAWVPKGIVVHEVSTNIMLLAFVPLCLFAQWAVYSVRRGDRGHAGLALFLVALMAVAIINAQAFAWSQMGVVVREEGAYGPMFYGITGLFVVLMVAGITFTAVTALRYLGGHRHDTEIVSAHALFWYVMAGVYAAIWFVVYVTK
jgi:cytochrome c oxidase subunit 3